MKRIVLTAFLSSFFTLFTFSQNPDNVKEDVTIIDFSKPPPKRVVEETSQEPYNAQEEFLRFENTLNFLKRVESNMLAVYTNTSSGRQQFVYNTESKGDKENLLLGDFNAPVEFFVNPSFEAPSSLRIVKDSLNTWNLEVKYISNFKEVNGELYDKYPSIGYSFPVPSDEEIEQMREHNVASSAKRDEECLNLYKVDTLLLRISNQFADQLYEKMVSLIVNFKIKGFLNKLAFDGYSVSFRAVIDYEVWSLWISNPPDENVQKMANLCLQIITDVQANQLEEKKYIAILNTFKD